MRHRIVAFGLLALAVGCRRDPAPLLPPDVPDAAPAPPAGELSRFSAPLAYDFSGIMAVVDRAVPTTFGSLDSVHAVPNDDRRHFAFAAERGPFTAYAEGNLVHLRATVTYAVRGYYKPPLAPTISGGCGNGNPDERPRLLIELATPLTLSANWHLSSKASLVTIEPASHEQRDHCDVTFLHRDITERVVEAARSAMVEHLPDIDRRVAEIDLHQRFAELWRTMQRPIGISDGVWLALNPERLAIGGMTGRAHVLTIPVTLDARPSILTSDTMPVFASTPLPPLAHEPAANGFHIVLDGDIDYAAASGIVDRALTGRTFTQSGRTVTVRRATLSPASNGRLALVVGFSGDANGTLRFIGTPTLDTSRNQVAMRDLDYAVSTDNPLIDTYAWLRSDAMRATLRERARLPVDSALTMAKSMLTAGLNRQIGDVMTLNASVRTVAVRGLYVTRGGIIVRGEATGRAGVAVRTR